MLQLAAGLRRQGVRTVHVGPVTGRDARLMIRWVFGEGQTLAEFLESGFLDPSIVDVQGGEREVRRLAPLADDPRTPPRLAGVLRHRLAFHDKLDVAHSLRDGGVPVPDTWPATDVASALGASGLPVVVKRRVGAGGRGVAVARDEDEVRAAVERWRPDVFLERYEPGPTHQYAAVLAGGDVLVDLACRSVATRTARGPATGVVVDQDAAVLDAGRGAVAVVGGSGLVNLDVQMTAAGPRVVDVNLRAWDSLVPLRAAGADLVAAYVDSLRPADGSRERPATRSPRVGSRVSSFPADAQVAAREGRSGAALGLVVTRGPRYLAWLGPGYVAHALWLVALEWRSARRARRAAPASSAG
jgi:hypothetical protein